MSELVLEKNNLPKNWIFTQIQEVCETKSGGTPSRKNPELYEGDIPWVKSGELNDSLISSCEETISELGLQKSNATIFPQGTVLMAMYGATIGKLGILNLDASTNQAICAFFNEKRILDSKYLFYFLRHSKENLIKSGFGGAQNNISQEIIKKVVMPIPPLNEQKRIVSKIEELFSNLIKCEESLKKIKSRFEMYKLALLFSAFKGDLTHDWRKNNDKLTSKDSLVKKIEKLNQKRLRKKINPEVNLSTENLPKNWVLTHLNNIIKVIMGQSPPGSSYNNKKNGLPLLNGPTEFGEVYPIPIQWTTDPKRVCSKNDLLFCVRGNTAGRMNWSDMEYCIGRGLAALRPLNGFFNLKLLFYFLLMKQNEILHSGEGTTFPNISKERLENYSIPIMASIEQTKIVKLLDYQFTITESLIASVKTYVELINRLRVVILKSAFDGKLIPQDPNDEPAEILLQKIKQEKEKFERKQKIIKVKSQKKRKKNVK